MNGCTGVERICRICPPAFPADAPEGIAGGILAGYQSMLYWSHGQGLAEAG
jgi:hypothetical protein